MTSNSAAVVLLLLAVSALAVPHGVLSNADTTPPFITNLVPRPGTAAVAPDTSIFCEIRDAGSGVAQETIQMWVNGLEVRPRIFPVYYGEPGYSVHFHPSQSFNPGQAVAVSYAAADRAGNPVMYQYAFTVADGGEDNRPPTVVFTQPTNGAVNVSPRTEVIVGLMDDPFNFMSSTIDPDSVVMRVNEAEVSLMKMAYEGGLLARHRPSAPLEQGALYEVEIDACDSLGNCMPTYRFSFAVMTGGHGDSSPPVILDLHPPHGAAGVAVDAPVSFNTLDLPMSSEPSGINPDSVIVTINDVPAIRTLFPIERGYRVEVEHLPFPAAEGIEVSVWVCDFAGNCAEDHSHFQTASASGEDHEPPFAAAPFPQDGAVGVPVTTEVYVELYDGARTGPATGIDPQSIQMVIEGQAVPFSLRTLPGNGYIVHWTNPFAFPSASFVAIEISACDYAGNCMVPFAWSFMTAMDGEDTEPPVIDQQSPAPSADNIDVASEVSFILRDAGSGINLDSIVVAVDGIPAEDAILLGDSAEVRVVYDPPGDLRAGADIVVMVLAADLADNTATFAWSFHTAASGSTAPQPVYPMNDAWLNRLLEQGMIKFSWTSWGISAVYRIEVSIYDLPVFTLDYGPDNYSFALGLATVSYPVAANSWDVLAELGSISWRVVEIDMIGGSEVSAYSDPFSFTLARTDSVTLRTPEDFSVLSPSEPPVFTWDPDPTASGYLFGLAHAAEDGIYFDEIYSADIPYFMVEIPVTDEVWQQLSPGYWIWTALALDAQGQYGNFMMFHFEKSVAE